MIFFRTIAVLMNMNTIGIGNSCNIIPFCDAATTSTTSTTTSPTAAAGNLFTSSYIKPPRRNKMKRNHHIATTYPEQQQQRSNNRMTMANVTCYNYTQPLDHFNPGSNNDSFEQRYCIYHGYQYDSSSSSSRNIHNNTQKQNPIFFYTGNESPIDEYVNNTGLIWELAPKFNALVVFVEHRFEGTSIPDIIYNYNNHKKDNGGSGSGSDSGHGGCFTYLTTSQALADYASLISFLNPNHTHPVITFGGSYGGMLSAWMRIVYGSIVAGSIASSAPMWGLPKTMLSGLVSDKKEGYKEDDDNDMKIMDRASYVVGQALLKDVNNKNNSRNFSSISITTNETNYCYDNLLATWPLIHYYGQSIEGRSLLSDAFHLCQPLQNNEEDVQTLLHWAQSPWFDLAEGDYPYPSSYIPYALGEGLHDLPSWPLQEACHGSSGLKNDFGIEMYGDFQNVDFDVRYGQGDKDSLILSVDWNTIEVKQVNTTKNLEDIARPLFSAVRDAVSIWFNVTKSLDCFDVIPAINEDKLTRKFGNLQGFSSPKRMMKQQENNICKQKLDNETVWTPLVCNDNINLIMTYARGVGRDFFWPPSHPKDQRRYQDTINNRTQVEELYEEMCSDPDGIFGYPDKIKADPYSTWMDDYYGGRRIGQVSNILFANGLLDPWSAAGVFFPTDHSLANDSKNQRSCNMKTSSGEIYPYDCSLVQNITADGGLKAILLELGGHHLDLMYSSDMDPYEVKVARMIQENHIAQWIKDWKRTML